MKRFLLTLFVFAGFVFIKNNAYSTINALAGEPVPGAEVYVELEPPTEPIANIITDQNGEFCFTISNAVGVCDFTFTILPTKAFIKKHGLPSKAKYIVKLKLKPSRKGVFNLVLYWKPDQKAQNRGTFAVSGKSDS